MIPRTKKHLIFIAYDILEHFGKRINLSVFECMMTDTQLRNISEFIGMKINKKTDYVAYYPICRNCYTKVIYQIPKKRTFEKVNVV